MKGLAEEVEGRPMDDTEVSSWYAKRALEHVLDDPARELELLGRRALLLVNDVEATTYANVDYPRSYSPVLRWAPTFALLFALALPGALLAWRRELAHLWLPLAAGVAAVLLFFYIARLRILVVRTLGIFTGAAVGRAVAFARGREWRPLVAAAVVGTGAAALALLPLLRPDASNEWNKAGGAPDRRALGRRGSGLRPGRAGESAEPEQLPEPRPPLPRPRPERGGRRGWRPAPANSAAGSPTRPSATGAPSKGGSRPAPGIGVARAAPQLRYWSASPR